MAIYQLKLQLEKNYFRVNITKAENQTHVFNKQSA